MRKEEIERLRYRNQYLLAPESITCPFMHQEHKVDEAYRLYTHIDLQVTACEASGTKMWLLGDLFDYESPQKSNSHILADLIHSQYHDLLYRLGNFAGRFVLINLNKRGLKLVHDATAARKIYYTKNEGIDWFSSQPHLLAKVLNLQKTTNPEILDFYASDVFKSNHNASIGNITIYDEVKQLMPNHFYNANTSSKIRYWPYCRTKERSLKEAASLCAGMVKGYMESITNRYEVMLPVTAGKDSRTLLAATKNHPEKVFYYVNKEKGKDETFHDIAVPKKLLSDLGLEFNILEYSEEVDEDFKKVYFENNEYACERFLPLIYNYYLHFGDKVNLPGNTATAGSEWFLGTKFPMTALNLAKKNQVERWSFAIDYYEEWLEEVKEACPNNNINLHDLYYWEERMANWSNQVQQEKDIAQEEINIFNSRELVTQYLSVHSKYLEIHSFKVYIEVIRQLWPELLKYPINKFFKHSLLKVLRKVRVLNFYQKSKYA
jgi:hypothetical protein